MNKSEGRLHAKTVMAPIAKVAVEAPSLDGAVHSTKLDSNTLNYRYSTLAQLWMHHNTTHLQWPVVIIGVVLVGLATLSASMISQVSVVPNWGVAPPVQALGSCFLIASIAVALMCRVMSRARLIMLRTEQELKVIEQMLGVEMPLVSFSELNHPPGVSGPRLLRYYLTIGIWLPITVLGLLFVAGPVPGSIMSALSFGWVFWDIRHVRRKN